jgi:MFS family permease
MIILLSLFILVAQGITMTYVPDMAVSKGISRYDSAALISIIGVTNTVVRIVAGFIVDVFHIRTLHLYIGALCLGAVSNVAFPWCHSFPLLAVCAVGFGLCMGKFFH